MTLLQMSAGRPFLTDGGLETTLVFRDGIDLPDFAAFPLLDIDHGRAALARYYEPYLDLAAETGSGFVLDTPTWRANLDWGARLGYDATRLAAVNQRAVQFVTALADERPGLPRVINGVIGPRGDGYVVGTAMSASEAAAYHGLQARAFAQAGSDMISAITMTYAEEAIGVVRAATAVALPVVISFTTEIDGRLPSGQTLGDAIDQVDAATGGTPAYYMVNCAHPTHFAAELDPTHEWVQRIGGIRANASRLSHAELDEATELDRGDIAELGSFVRRPDHGTVPARRRRLLWHRRRTPPHHPPRYHRRAGQPLTATHDLTRARFCGRPRAHAFPPIVAAALLTYRGSSWAPCCAQDDCHLRVLIRGTTGFAIRTRVFHHDNITTVNHRRTSGTRPAGLPVLAELRCASKTYGKGGTSVAAVRDLDLAVRPGEVLAVLGPNGAGKSTAISLLTGLRFWPHLHEAGRWRPEHRLDQSTRPARVAGRARASTDGFRRPR